MTKPYTLHRSQKALIRWLIDYAEKNAAGPAAWELASHFEVTSSSMVTSMHNLEKRGFVLQDKNKLWIPLMDENRVAFKMPTKDAVAPVPGYYYLKYPQYILLDWIIKHTSEHGYPPTTSEAAAAVKTTRANVTVRLKTLEKVGYIRKTHVHGGWMPLMDTTRRRIKMVLTVIDDPTKEH